MTSQLLSTQKSQNKTHLISSLFRFIPFPLQMSSLLHRYLVSHPTISTFQWTPTVTPAASLPFLSAAIAAYLTLTLLLHRRLLRLPSLPPPLLRLLSSLHNLTLLLLSLTMALGCSLSALSTLPSPRHLFCFPPNATPPAGPLFFWAYVFYLSKLYEFGDTLLIILSNTRRLTFLHVYHHSVVVVMCYVWMQTRQSLMPVALVTNAAVHVAMYAYYLSASLGWRWRQRWKRAVTELQIWQFAFSFGVSGVFLWFHFRGGGCEGFGGWVFNAVFNASLFGLFLDFHARSYRRTMGEKKKRSAD